MKRLALSVVLSLVAPAAFAAGPVASLTAQEGVVMVNQGQEFVTATEAQALQPGDTVMVMEGASASLVFNDGCALPIASGSMLVVPEQSTCAGAVADVRKVGPSYAQVSGDNTSSWELTEWAILGGVAVVVGVVVANDDDEPSSP
ncbi:hypothetical protein [Arenimonas composti]|uniref:Uncharacterized protein n=1 Tax=Arenimonas composti TR7-09 = DSM 18010 TaxID=1121013 RepID=A0A091B111_9GAMM|nr:hypothetical protein [Arenimonas composti]KFN45257.1 hypothetical protein P873_02215 [Arenimonas composti TR7-09 = DSM 18010]